MADQVNPLGSLVPGAAQAASPVPVSPRPVPKRPSVSGTSEPEGMVRPDPKSASGEGLDGAAARVAEFIRQSPAELHFQVDKATGQYFFKVVDPVTQETIRQVPSEEVLAMARRLQALDDPRGATGVLMDAEG